MSRLDAIQARLASRATLPAALRILIGALVCAAGASAAPTVDAANAPIELPPLGLRAQDLALIVNDADPASVEVGRYYAQQREIGAERVMHVRFPAGQASMSAADFEALSAQLRAQLPATVQAYALAWTLPYRVECMSITSAFAFGFDRAYCAEGCKPTKRSPYFDNPSNAPFTDLGLRPAMLLAGKTVADAKALIDRGVRSDGRWPDGAAYLLNTGDRARNVRAVSYDDTRTRLQSAYPIRRIDGDALERAQDVMFYFSGVARVPGLASNRFVDGAVADHLTSLGGLLDDSPQTTALEWLTAGATGSYGTTSEPCNYRAKFPEIAVVMGHYLGGETLIEAYWKSVRMPGQGVFVGEPLARPFGGVRVLRNGPDVRVLTRSLRPGLYLLQHAAGRIGPYRTQSQLTVARYGVSELRVPVAAGHYRLLPVPPTRPVAASGPFAAR